MSARADAIKAVINAYLDLPDTPDEADYRDVAIAAELIDSAFDLDHILHAIKTGFVRRWARDHSQGPLEPIRSLAYFRRVLKGLSDAEFEPDYAFYISYKYSEIQPDPQAWLERQLRTLNSSCTNNNENRSK